MLSGRTVGVGLLVGLGLLVLLVGIAWRTTNVLWFLSFPVLLVGLLIAAAAGVLWGLRHF